MNTDDLLQERGKTHGDWAHQSAVAASIKLVLREALGYSSRELPPPLSEALDIIAVKLARIVCGDALEPDHWRDIAGYARLAEVWVMAQEGKVAA